MKYYLHYECPNCGKDVYELCINLVKYNNLPVFDLDDNAQKDMVCDSCGCCFGTGDIDIFSE